MLGLHRCELASVCACAWLASVRAVAWLAYGLPTVRGTHPSPLLTRKGSEKVHDASREVKILSLFGFLGIVVTKFMFTVNG